jgi:hypothetical protein
MKIFDENVGIIPFNGLSYLITFHKFCGISYFGASVNQENNKRKIILFILSIIWNLIFFGFTINLIFEFLKFNINSFNKIRSNSSKLLIITILKILGKTGYYIQSFAINILLILRGKRILELFRAQSFNYIDSRSERRIGLSILFIQFILFLALELIMIILHLIYSIETFNIFVNLVYFSIMINISSIIALIAYQSKIISIQIDKISKNFSPKDLSKLYQFICKVKNFVKNFDSLISNVIFMLIFNSSVSCIAYLSLTAVESNKNSIRYIVCMSENILLLTTLCYSCDMVPKKIKEFSDKIEELMLDYVYTDVNQNLIIVQIDFLKQDIGFTGMGFFKINSNTIISVFALVLSNSVILIQTSGLSFTE